MFSMYMLNMLCTIVGVCILQREGPNSYDQWMPTVEATVAFFTKYYPTAFPGGTPSREFCQDFWSRKAVSLRTTYCNKLAHGNVCLVRPLIPLHIIYIVVVGSTKCSSKACVSVTVSNSRLQAACYQTLQLRTV
jgi:hypothetical protein